MENPLRVPNRDENSLNFDSCTQSNADARDKSDRSTTGLLFYETRVAPTVGDFSPKG